MVESRAAAEGTWAEARSAWRASRISPEDSCSTPRTVSSWSSLRAMWALMQRRALIAFSLGGEGGRRERRGMYARVCVRWSDTGRKCDLTNRQSHRIDSISSLNMSTRKSRERAAKRLLPRLSWHMESTEADRTSEEKGRESDKLQTYLTHRSCSCLIPINSSSSPCTKAPHAPALMRLISRGSNSSCTSGMRESE